MISTLKFLTLDKEGITLFSKQSRHWPGLGRNLIAANKYYTAENIADN